MKQATKIDDLTTLREQVDEWREQRTKRTRIPKELWAAAVRVARARGVYEAYKATKFDYNDLKARAALAETNAGAPEGAATEAATFLELKGVQLAASGGTTVVEIVGRRGGRMRIDVSGGGVDLVGLAQAFWRHEA